MSEKKHLSEEVLDYIDVCRRSREKVDVLSSSDAYDFRIAIDMETDAMSRYMRSAWERIHRLGVIAERISQGKSAVLSTTTGETK